MLPTEYIRTNRLDNYARRLNYLNDQGGVVSVATTHEGLKGTARFPIAFKKVLTAVGTLHASVGRASGSNFDDGISWTNTSVSFAYYSYYYISFGL